MKRERSKIEILRSLILNNDALFSADNSILSWASPVISFGNIEKAQLATVGLNPSDKEFIDNDGRELEGANQRFPTLKSLNLKSWDDVNEDHLNDMMAACNNYFARNPYDAWFKKLDYIISGSGSSYYFPSSRAVHLDLIPYCTFNKWSDLKSVQKGRLLKNSACFLLEILLTSKIDVLILNGQTVVDNFEKIANVKLIKERMPSWDLPRKSNVVPGYCYCGELNHILDQNLGRDILILGYNHNIQSSYGITNQIQNEIRTWITNKINR